MASLTLKNLTKRFPGRVRAVTDLSLDVADGELIVLVGPSGCGKTTLLRMIAGLESPTSGSVVIDGQDVNMLPPKDRDIAMVFQHHGLYPHLNVRRNLAFGLRLRGVDKAEAARRVDEVAKLLGIRQLLARRVDELSGGQRQRVALGRAIVCRPRLFLFDEPLSSLDADLRGQLRREIRHLHSRLQTTMIYVTHDRTEAMTLGQRIAVMYEGRLQQVAEPMMLYDEPANRFVAELLGTPSINFIEGHIKIEENLPTFTSGRLSLAIPPSVMQCIELSASRPVILGLRPEHVTILTEDAAKTQPSLKARVEAIESIGPELHVELDIKGHMLGARASNTSRLARGDRVCVALCMERTRLFDGETGEAICFA